MTQTTGLDQKLLSEVTFLICSTVSECQDYKNPFKVAGEIAKNITSWIQNDRNSRQTAPEHPDNKLVKFDTKIIKPDPAVTKTVERIHADAVQAANNDYNKLLKKIQDAELETPGFLTKESDGPTWMSENINLGEYWVYDYLNPCTTMNGKHGGRAAQTEIWLVHRRTFKFVVVDAEFPSLEDLRDFLDPRKALAAENNITPLEQIDAELAGRDEKQRAECRAAKKQSQFNRFIEYYHQYNGDADLIAKNMGIQKQSVYAYKNKAKSMGILS